MMELVPYSARGDRLVSRFHAEELLYEYVQGTLDTKRADGVKKIVDQDPKLKLEIEAIRRALAYCDTLSRVQISTARIDTIRNEATAFDQFLQKMKMHELPGGIRVGMESLLVISLVFFFAMMVPWNTLISVLQENQGTVLLSEVSKENQPKDLQNDLPAMVQKNSLPTLPADQQAKTGEKISEDFDDEGVPQEELVSMKKQVDSLSKVVVPSTQVPSPLKPVTTPTPASAPSTVAPEKKTEARIAATTTREPAKASTGWLNKGRLTLTNVGAITPKIVEAVTGLGGRKAGQVPLGWAKGKGSYFHFTIPEAKYEELVGSLKNFGKLTIVREPHDRVMPEGIVRVIIDIEEAASGTKKETVEFIPDAVNSDDGAAAEPRAPSSESPSTPAE